jgi:staphylococcal nuclease domain-containing protein 1
LVHLQVRIVLEGADKFNNLIGSIHYPDKDAAIDLSLELVKQGLARVVEWSANMLEEEAKKRLKTAELQAKKDRLKIWTNYVPPATNSKAIRDVNFTGKVIEVVSGDCIVVADDAAPFSSPAAERRVNLSSIRAPKIGNPKKDERPAAYAREAKEYLRTLLIGQQVNVSMEYSRKMGLTDGPTPVPATPGVDRTMDFGSVFLLSVPKGEAFEMPPSLAVAGQPQGVNVAEIIVARGFATVVRHRDFEERSNYYEALLAAEAKALKAKKKIHSQKESPVAHINDLSLQGTTKKAKDFLPFLQRSRRLPAIVDYVLSGARFKLMIPKETCAIAFSLSGVRSLGRGEPYADESICFMRHRILQRDVEIEVETVDKTGTFLGSLWDAKGNVSVALLENGLAKLHPMFSPERTTEGHLLVQAQARAKKQLLKVWEGYVEGQDEAKSATSDSTNVRDTSVIVVRVTDILGGGRFYIQSVEDARVGAIQQSLEGLRLKDMHMLPSSFQPAKGDTVIAQFTGDDSWNRALIVTAPRQVPTSGKAEYDVFYIDYGNQETVPHSRLRPLDPAVSSPLQGLAQLCSLAHVKVPELEEAAQFISGVVSNKVFRMIVEEKDTTGGKVKGQGTGPRLIVTLIDQETNKSIQAILLEVGLARLEKKHDWDSPEKKEIFAKYEQLQDEARKARHNIWMYGDIESDEEDNSRFQRGSARR